MRFLGNDNDINLKTANPEFLEWKWIDLDSLTKAQIRSAFKKSLNKSKFNRKILSEFVELVA